MAYATLGRTLYADYFHLDFLINIVQFLYFN